MQDTLGDILKTIEGVETNRRLDRSLPVYARLDGRGFSKFTHGMNRPYDSRFSTAMIQTTKTLVEKTHAKIGFTQSDEISLLWHLNGENPAEELLFGGKIQKIVSVLSGLATAALTHAIATHQDISFRDYINRLPHFDARVMNVDTKQIAVDMFRWREQDARRNAISMMAHHVFGAKAIMNVGTRDRVRMLEEHGIVMDELPTTFRQGTYVKKRVYGRTLSDEEWFAIPERNRPDRDRVFQRGLIEEIAMSLTNINNPEEVLFDAKN